MGLYTSFHLIYGYRLSPDLKDKAGKALDPFDETFLPYLEGQKEVDPFTLLWDQMGSGQETVFGQALCNMDGNDEADISEIDVNTLQTIKLKNLYKELFRDYDVPDVEPKLLCVVHVS